MWKVEQTGAKAKLSISINHHHTEPGTERGRGMYARAAPPGRAGIAWWLSTVARMWKTRMDLTVARLPDAESTALRFNFGCGTGSLPGDPTDAVGPSRSVRAALWR